MRDEQHGGTVLLVDRDSDRAAHVRAVLEADGFAVKTFAGSLPLAAQVERSVPVCVILGGDAKVYVGWEDAANLSLQFPSVPIAMLCRNAAEAAEARSRVTPRARAAHFAGIIEDAYAPGELLRVVRACAARFR